MQYCSREIQAMNSLITQSLQDQQQTRNPHFDPTSSSHDNFLEQMVSSIPSCSWNDLKSPWDLTTNDRPTAEPGNVGFHFDESAILASKLCQHQISGGGWPSVTVTSQGGDGSVQALSNGFTVSPHGSVQAPPNQVQQHVQHPQGWTLQAQNHGVPGAPDLDPAQPTGPTGGQPGQPRQRVRARRGQATDPHSIAERLRRERIAERMKGLQELVPNANKTDKASMLDEIIDYVKFLRLQVKVLSMSRLGGSAAVAPDISSEGGGECIQASANGGNAASNDSLTVTGHQVVKLMEEDMGSAMQYLQGKGLCLMPLSLATAISTSTCHARNPINNNSMLQLNGEGPSSPSISVLTVQSAIIDNGGGGDVSAKYDAVFT